MKETQVNHRYWYVFTGSYSSSEHEGICLLLFDSEVGNLKRLDGISGIENPSFLALDSQRFRLFAVGEVADGVVASYTIDQSTGKLNEINRQFTKGSSPCYLSLDKQGNWLYSVNYQKGSSVEMFSIEKNGAIGALADDVQHAGHSVQADRQEGPHPHSVVSIPSSSFLLVPDLGTDHIYIYRNDSIEAGLKLHAKVESQPGAGPRHIAFHPNASFAYVIHELNNTIAVYSYDNIKGLLSLLQSVHTLPGEFLGTSYCADIHVSPSGHYLYGSNRGDDSIATFRILNNGMLESVGYTSTMGKTPRNFIITPDGKFILVANQDSDSIVVMRLGMDGIPIPTGQSYEISKPVCLQMMPAIIESAGK